MMVGRLPSFWEGLVSGAMLNFRGVYICIGFFLPGYLSLVVSSGVPGFLLDGTMTPILHSVLLKVSRWLFVLNHNTISKS